MQNKQMNNSYSYEIHKLATILFGYNIECGFHALKKHPHLKA